MHIVLLILKILLIVVLSLIGLVVFLALLVMLAPVRYKAYVSKKDSISAKLTVTWLGFVLCFKGRYDSEGLYYRLKLFGGTLYGNNSNKKSPGMAIGRTKESKKGNSLNEQTVSEDNAEEKMTSDVTSGEASNLSDYSWADADDREFLLEDYEFEEKKENIFTKLGKTIDRLFTSVKDRINSMVERASELSRKKDDFIRLYNNVRTKETIRIAKLQIISILKHIKPTKIKGQVTYGTGDPASTGQQLAYMSVLFPFYYDKLDITPDFQNKIIEGNLYVKGRIRLGTIAWHVIKFIFNKNVRITIERFKRIKGGNQHGKHEY